MASSLPFYDPSWIYRDVIKAGASTSLAASRMIDLGKIVKTTDLINTGFFAELQPAPMTRTPSLRSTSSGSTLSTGCSTSGRRRDLTPAKTNAHHGV